MNTFGERLRALRKKDAGKSQKEYGKLFGLSESAIGMYERNERNPDYDTLNKIAEYHKVSINFLLTGKDGDSNNDMWKDLLDPKKQLFFKDLMNAPEEKVEELIRFWEFMKERDKKK